MNFWSVFGIALVLTIALVGSILVLTHEQKPISIEHRDFNFQIKGLHDENSLFINAMPAKRMFPVYDLGNGLKVSSYITFTDRNRNEYYIVLVDKNFAEKNGRKFDYNTKEIFSFEVVILDKNQIINGQ